MCGIVKLVKFIYGGLAMSFVNVVCDSGIDFNQLAYDLYVDKCEANDGDSVILFLDELSRW